MTAIRHLLQRFRLSRVAGLLLLAVLVAIRLVDPIPAQLLRLTAFDLFQRLYPREIKPFPVAIIDIDDRSLAEVGQWPWPRTQIAALTERAMEAGSVAVAFDIVFAEPDRLSPDRIATDNPALPEGMRAEMAALPPNDRVLADVFARSRVVVGQTSVRIARSGAPQQGPVPEVPHAFVGPDPRPFMLHFPELVQNRPELEVAAAGRGVFTVKPDPDGIYRRVPMVMIVQDEIRLSLVVELLRIGTGGDAFAVKSNDAGVDGVVVAKRLIRTEADGTVWVRFSPSNKNRFVSAADLLNGRVPPGRLAGHLVLIGTSAIGLEDFRATPLGIPMPGVEIHAQLLENILDDSLLLRSNTALAQELVWIVGLSLLVIFLAPMLAARWLILSTVALIGSYLGFAHYLFIREAQLLDPTFPVLATVLTAMLISSANYLREERRRNQIRSAFGQYVSPTLVAQLADHPERLTLGGERRELSILFSDVRGFTSIAERFRDDPQGLTQLMNRFLTVMSNEIMACHGTIDKFMGDAVMAFWNAPLNDPKHAHGCCKAALNMMRAVDELNQQRKARPRVKSTYHPIEIGIGINTGECVVGNMGSAMRFDYTALGDAVNLASRLEGQTKTYGVSIVIGETTARAVAREFALIELDLIRVKGKLLPERIFGLLGDAKLAGDSRFPALASANAAFISAYRAADFDTAEREMDAVLQAASALELDLSGYERFLRERLDKLRRNPPDPGWDGVFVAEYK